MDYWGGLFFGGVAEGKGPMHQFEIQRLVPIEVAGYDLSFTNSALWMVLVAVAATSLFTLAMSPRAMVPGRLQLFAEMTYTTIADMVRSTAGEKGMDFFSFVFSLFIFVLFANLFGMIPGSFTVTSHIIVTFALAAVVISLVVLYGFWKHGLKFLKLFVPDGVPILILPLIVLIELISFLSRPISLSVRLFANMLAGHTMLKVFAGFIVMLGATELAILGIAPLIAIVALTALEFLIAALQAYIFAILTCVYLADAIHLHGHADEHH